MSVNTSAFHKAQADGIIEIIKRSAGGLVEKSAPGWRVVQIKAKMNDDLASPLGEECIEVRLVIKRAIGADPKRPADLVTPPWAEPNEDKWSRLPDEIKDEILSQMSLSQWHGWPSHAPGIAALISNTSYANGASDFGAALKGAAFKINAV